MVLKVYPSFHVDCCNPGQAGRTAAFDVLAALAVVPGHQSRGNVRPRCEGAWQHRLGALQELAGNSAGLSEDMRRAQRDLPPVLVGQMPRRYAVVVKARSDHIYQVLV